MHVHLFLHTNETALIHYLVLSKIDFSWNLAGIFSLKTTLDMSLKICFAERNVRYFGYCEINKHYD